MEKTAERELGKTSRRTRMIVMTAAFAALACVATMVVKVPSPTGGYMNLGDTVVLLGGYLLGPGWGALAGSIIGASAAMLKGAVRAVIMRFIDGMMSFPGILLAMMLVTVLGKGILGAVLAIGLFMVPTFSRLVYSMVLENKQRLYIKAAHSYGCSGGYIVLFHMLPDMLPRLITQFSSSIGGAVLLESSLSFLGLGIQPPTPSWGMMLNEARQFVLNYPYIAIAPGVVLLITVLGFNLLGDGLNDRLVKRRSKT